MSDADFLTSIEDALWSRSSFSFMPDLTWPMPDEPAAGLADGAAARVVFVGLPSPFSVAFLIALLRLPVHVVAVLTSPTCHPAVAAQNVFDAIGAWAGAPVLRPARVRSDEGMQQLEALNADAAVMASFDQIIRPPALALPRHGWLNVHPSLLPAYRGPEPVYWAVAEGAETVGITAHRVVPTFDAGPILAQRELAGRPDDTSGTLARRLTEAGVGMLGDAVDALLNDEPGRDFEIDPTNYRPSVGHRALNTAVSAAEALRWVRAGTPDIPAWLPGPDGPLYAHAARCVEAGCGTLSYPDADLLVDESSPRCRCASGANPCGRLEGAPAPV